MEGLKEELEGRIQGHYKIVEYSAIVSGQRGQEKEGECIAFLLCA